MQDEFKCNGGVGGIAAITLVQASDLKRNSDGKLRLKRKYGKFKRPVVHYDFREPEVIGLA